VEAILGKDILKYEGLVERMFEIYVSTVDKFYWGRQYLSLEFFQLVCQSDFVKNLCFMVATRLKGEELRADHVFAGTFNIVKDGVFYGRYWGCLAENQVKNLHFETCYWSAIDFCIQNGLKRMEPGAGGGGTCYI
jgi:predicted N-acyltransferase